MPGELLVAPALLGVGSEMLNVLHGCALWKHGAPFAAAYIDMTRLPQPTTPRQGTISSRGALTVRVGYRVITKLCILSPATNTPTICPASLIPRGSALITPAPGLSKLVKAPVAVRRNPWSLAPARLKNPTTCPASLMALAQATDAPWGSTVVKVPSTVRRKLCPS